MKVVGLEMGGKSPFIVLDDAVLDDATIENAAMSAFWNGGQNCSANMRQLVHRKIAGEFAERVVVRAKQFRLGNPLDPETTLPAMVTAEHQERVMGYIDKGRGEGGSCSTVAAAPWRPAPSSSPRCSPTSRPR